jgi:multidrug efflux system membrane fusion protein
VANAQVESAQSALETAQVNLDYCSIKVADRRKGGAALVDAGNVVEANTAQLLSIQRLERCTRISRSPSGKLSEVQRQMAQGTLRTLGAAAGGFARFDARR